MTGNYLWLVGIKILWGSYNHQPRDITQCNKCGGEISEEKI